MLRLQGRELFASACAMMVVSSAGCLRTEVGTASVGGTSAGSSSSTTSATGTSGTGTGGGSGGGSGGGATGSNTGSAAPCDPKNNNAPCVTANGNPGSCCLSECAETVSDPFNCGACGIACPIAIFCQNGICVTDAGGLAGCGTGDPSVCPPETACSWDLFVSPCFTEVCPPGSDGIQCVVDAGWLGACCAGACAVWSSDGGC